MQPRWTLVRAGTVDDVVIVDHLPATRDTPMARAARPALPLIVAQGGNRDRLDALVAAANAGFGLLAEHGDGG